MVRAARWIQNQQRVLLRNLCLSIELSSVRCFDKIFITFQFLNRSHLVPLYRHLPSARRPISMFFLLKLVSTEVSLLFV